MKCKSADIISLLDAMAAEAGYKLLNANYPLIHEKMKEWRGKKSFFAEEYLYKKVLLRARNAEDKGGGILILKDEYVEIIAEYAGFESYSDFLQQKVRTISPMLENCEGKWYSYVRCNSGDMFVLISPVQIYQQKKQMCVEMKGPSRTFKGELRIEGSCIHTLVESGEGKSIHIVLKIGISKHPRVLQGIFSGMSSGGDPIAGRELFVRQPIGIDSLEPKKIKISSLLNSPDEEERMIGIYFSDMPGNILKGGPASTFELSDLKKK